LQAEEQLKQRTEPAVAKDIAAGVEEEAEMDTEKQSAPFDIREIPPRPSLGGVCDCCGRNNIPQSELVRIDSGHLFCPDCVAALRR
jgi:hypothetical protein